MANSAVLKGEYLKRTNHLSNLGFSHKSGYLVKFTLNNKVYVHVNHTDFRSDDQDSAYTTAGYYEEAKFLLYSVKKIERKELPGFKLNLDTIENGSIGDRVQVKKLKIKGPDFEFCKLYDISWTYEGGEIVDGNFDIPKEPISTVSTVDIPVHSVAKAFYLRNIELVKSNLFPDTQKENAAYIIAKIALYINNIQNNIYPLFMGDEKFQSYITSQNLEWSSVDIFNNPILEDYKTYLENITEFYEALYSNQLTIKNAKSQTKLYWLGFVLSERSLKIIPAYDKIEILRSIAEGVILGALSNFVLTTQNEEEYAIKILRSIIGDQQDDLLAGLLNVAFIDGKKRTTLYQSLYDKINDTGIGAENLRIFIDEIYRIWVGSSYNPYSLDGSPMKDNLINPGTYRSNPILLKYESSRILGMFNASNYDFSFNSSRIEVTEEMDQVGENTVTTFTNKIGDYEMYQALTISNTPTNTNDTKFLAINLNGTSQVAIPIFYLKYIDDKKSTENLITGAELTAELIMTLSAVGNLSKLRHLRSLGKLGRVALSLEAAEPGLVLIRYELAQGVLSAIEITSELASIFINYSTNYRETYCDVKSSKYNADDCKFYTRLDNFFFALQLVGSVIDLAFSKKLRTAASEMLNGPIPNDFNPDALNVLRKFAGSLDEIREIFRVKLMQKYGDNSNIWRKIDRSQISELSNVKKDDFIFEFENATEDLLDLFNADHGSLIDFWGKLSRDDYNLFKGKRTFFSTFKTIQNSKEMIEEVFKGKCVGKLKEGATDLYINYKWRVVGVHHIDALDEIGARMIGPKRNIGDNIASGYYTCKVEVYDVAFKGASSIDGAIGWKVKAHLSTFFPDEWTALKVKREMALAYSKKVYSYSQNGTDIFKGVMSDGVECIFYIRNGKITSAHPSFPKI
ncbi:hypothetical protein AQ505_20415 [Pedobacter sp. PACM 27299]|uniref:EndoU domain-containing protein n=1 Tax=Pedobacter sp. PACM 27299 TaxID=1727164 RepID=UPI0007058DD7|nr:EndoU domain-containing protein [Pedobacter sp. PACM 27299]ALL07644.1 hypothetical protein AQ505_20415 [Pedobacter sp. PACM 27299]